MPEALIHLEQIIREGPRGEYIAMVARKYSHSLGTISNDQFQAALDRFDLGTFLQAEPISFGFSKRNVFLTSTKGQFVFRGTAQSPQQHVKEQFFAQKLFERTSVPVPWPFFVDPTEDIFGWSYAIMPRMPGLQLADSKVKQSLTSEDRRGIAKAMGETLALLQELTWPFSGEYDAETHSIKPFETSYSELVITRIRYNLARSREHSDRTTSADVRWVEELISSARDALNIPFQPAFLMQDYKESNVVVEHTNGHWRVSGVFDLTHSHFGDSEADLCRTFAMYLDEDPKLAQEFLRAYVVNRRPRPRFAKRFPIYMLDDRLLIWEFCQLIGRPLWDERLTFREWASKYISACNSQKE